MMHQALWRVTFTTDCLTTSNALNSLQSEKKILRTRKIHENAYDLHTIDDLPNTIIDLHMAGVDGWDGQAMMRIGPERASQPTHSLSNLLQNKSIQMLKVKETLCVLVEICGFNGSLCTRVVWFNLEKVTALER